jgi:hypothetical protein
MTIIAAVLAITVFAYVSALVRLSSKAAARARARERIRGAIYVRV